MTQVDVDMMEEELKLESAYRLAGYETMQRNLQQAKENNMVDTATPIGQAFFTHKLLAVKDTIEQWLIKNMKPKAGVKPNV